ncbi:MAG: CPBP family intramembrane metalloprotease, partial [Firmicutes bacterium]|nr:CPBP family intramembrane metalloprotease [Candidatus Fiminaster equi]
PYIAGVVCFVAILFLGNIYSMILNVAGVKIVNNDNQQAINVTSQNFTLTSMVIFGILGPICEEITYRVGLFSFLKRISKWLAYPVVVLVFALIHFNFSASSLTNELLNLPYYLLAGFALTFTYDKFGFAGSTIAHVLNNVISLLPMTVALGVFH